MVPAAGLEPARPCGQGILNPSCLPISSRWHQREAYYRNLNALVNQYCRKTEKKSAFRYNSRPLITFLIKSEEFTACR